VIVIVQDRLIVIYGRCFAGLKNEKEIEREKQIKKREKLILEKRLRKVMLRNPKSFENSRPKLEFEPDSLPRLIPEIMEPQSQRELDRLQMITPTSQEKKIKEFQALKYRFKPSRTRTDKELVDLHYNLMRLKYSYDTLVQSQAKHIKCQEDLKRVKLQYGVGYHAWKKICLNSPKVTADTLQDFLNFRKQITAAELDDLKLIIKENKKLGDLRGELVAALEEYQGLYNNLEQELKAPPSFNYPDLPTGETIESNEFDILGNNEMVSVNYRHKFTKKAKEKEKKKNFFGKSF